MTPLWEKLIKTGARVVRHARYITFQPVEAAVPRKLFEAILQRIDRLRIFAEETLQGDAKGILMGSSATVLAFLVGGFFETNFHDSEVAMLLYFLMGISLAQFRDRDPKADLEKPNAA